MPLPPPARRLRPDDVGRRVVLRRVLDPDAPAGTGRRLTDVVGTLLRLDDVGDDPDGGGTGGGVALVDTRRGPVEVPLGLLVAAKVIPPARERMR